MLYLLAQVNKRDYCSFDTAVVGKTLRMSNIRLGCERQKRLFYGFVNKIEYY